MQAITIFILAVCMAAAQTSKQALYDEFMATKGDPVKAYGIAQQFLHQYPEDDEQVLYVKRWMAAYEKVMAKAATSGSAEIPGYPATLMSGYARTILSYGNRGHIFLEPERFVFKGDKGELTIPKADIAKVEAFSSGKWVANDFQGFEIQRRVTGKSKPERITLCASTEAWVSSHDKAGKMVDPKPLVEKINAWLSVTTSSSGQPVLSAPLSSLPTPGVAPDSRGAAISQVDSLVSLLNGDIKLSIVPGISTRMHSEAKKVDRCIIQQSWGPATGKNGKDADGDLRIIQTIPLTAVNPNAISLSNTVGEIRSVQVVTLAGQPFGSRQITLKKGHWIESNNANGPSATLMVADGDAPRVLEILKAAVASCLQ